jgi:hypothetical protein
VKADPEPAGIGGWLILPALGLIVSPILQGIQLVRDIFPALHSGALKNLSDPASPYYSAMWVPTIVFEAVSGVLIFAFTLWLGYLFFFRKTARVPRLFIIWLASYVLMHAIDWLLVNSLPQIEGQSDSGVMRELGRSVVSAAIWIPYFLQSIRVKNTFVDTVSA